MTSKTKKSDRIPEELEPMVENIMFILNDFCSKFLNDEYAEILRKLIIKMARKRPSPLLSGKPPTWAAGAIHAIGMVNFLFDPSQKPHVKSAQISEYFGLAQNTISAKSQSIRKLLKMNQMDVEWMTSSRIEDSPMTWFIIVNGFMVDAREMPLEVQLEALRVGAIPYLPQSR
jgi:Domain of unknown function (DUF6398)